MGKHIKTKQKKPPPQSKRKKQKNNKKKPTKTPKMLLWGIFGAWQLLFLSEWQRFMCQKFPKALLGEIYLHIECQT